MTARRLIVQDVNGVNVDYIFLPGDKEKKIPNHYKPNPHWEIDLTDFPNANAQCLPYVVIQTKCNLGHWHDTERIPLAPWGDS